MIRLRAGGEHNSMIFSCGFTCVMRHSVVQGDDETELITRAIRVSHQLSLYTVTNPLSLLHRF